MIDLERNLKDIPRELTVPMEVIDLFFNAGHPKEHCKDLRKWRYHVINEEQFKSRFGASHVFANYEETILLIKAANSLLEHYKVLSDCTSVAKMDIVKERNKWDYYPNNLKKKSLLKPSKVIVKFFKEISFNRYTEMLHEWLHLALSNKAAHETLSPKEIIDVYANLKKLYSAIWLIHRRLMQ